VIIPETLLTLICFKNFKSHQKNHPSCWVVAEGEDQSADTQGLRRKTLL